MEKGKEKVILGLDDEDEDKFLMALEQADPDEESYLDVKKRQELKKDLKRVDHSL